MDLVFQSEDLRLEILNQAPPDVIYHLAETNEVFRHDLQSEQVLKILSEKFGWYLTSFGDFKDAYHSTFLTPNVHRYMGHEKAFQLAIKEGDLVAADQIFEFLRFHNGLDVLGIFWIRAIGLSSSRNNEVLDWIDEKIRPYKINVDLEDFKAATKNGNIERFNRLLQKDFYIDPSNWEEMLSYAFASGSQQMVDRIFRLPTQESGVSWKNDRGEDLYQHDLSFDQAFWNKLMGSAIESGNPLMIEEVKKLAVDPSIKWDHTSLPMATGAMKTKNLDLIIKYVLPLLNSFDYNQKKSSTELAGLFRALASDYHPSNLNLMRDLLKWLPPTNTMNSSTIIYGIFHPIVESGDLSLLHYLVDYFKLSRSQLDIIYQYVIFVASYDNTITEIGLPKSFYLEERGIFEKITTLKGRRISRYSWTDPFNLPKHPGVFDWFRKHGNNPSLYKIDPLGMTVFNDGRAMIRAILSYRIDLSIDGKECLIEASRIEGEVGGIHHMIHLLLDDYRIGCLSFTSEEIKFIQNGPQVEALKLDLRFRKAPSPLIRIHSMNQLSYLERYQLMEKDPNLREVIARLKNDYMKSNTDLAEKLNDLKVPFIPCFNHLASSLFLNLDIDSGKFDRKYLFDRDLMGVVPSGIATYSRSALRYMIEKGTIKNLIGGKDWEGSQSTELKRR